MIHNHWLSITPHESQPLAQHYTPLFTTTGSVYHTMIQTPVTAKQTLIHSHWLSNAHHDKQPLAQHNTPDVNHGV
jgi:hypothetical protein